MRVTNQSWNISGTSKPGFHNGWMEVLRGFENMKFCFFFCCSGSSVDSSLLEASECILSCIYTLSDMSCNGELYF